MRAPRHIWFVFTAGRKRGQVNMVMWLRRPPKATPGHIVKYARALDRRVVVKGFRP